VYLLIYLLPVVLIDSIFLLQIWSTGTWLIDTRAYSRPVENILVHGAGGGYDGRSRDSVTYPTHSKIRWHFFCNDNRKRHSKLPKTADNQLRLQLIRIGSGCCVLGSHPVVLGSWAVLHERAPFVSRADVPDLLPLPPFVRYYYPMVFPPLRSCFVGHIVLGSVRAVRSRGWTLSRFALCRSAPDFSKTIQSSGTV
jgi:hypothetical protein